MYLSKNMRRNAYLFACISMAIAISLGALGAHKLEQELTANQLDSFKTGVFYQIIHALALLIIASFARHIKSKGLKTGLNLLKIGPILFSGSIYLLSTSGLLGIEAAKPVLGPITPIGGVLMIAGWIFIAVAISKTSFKDD